MELATVGADQLVVAHIDEPSHASKRPHCIGGIDVGGHKLADVVGLCAGHVPIQVVAGQFAADVPKSSFDWGTRNGNRHIVVVGQQLHPERKGSQCQSANIIDKQLGNHVGGGHVQRDSHNRGTIFWPRKLMGE